MKTNELPRRSRHLLAGLLAAVVPLLVLVAPAPSASAAEVGTTEVSVAAACARPTVSTFVSKMNELEDLSMSAFLSRKSNKSPCWIDWSDDGCSFSPDSGTFYNFYKSCRRHDFGYRNAKRAESWYSRNVWSYHNKAVADTTFRRDMTDHCFSRATHEIDPCLDKRTTYYNVVAGLGPFPPTTGDYRNTFLVG